MFPARVRIGVDRAGDWSLWVREIGDGCGEGHGLRQFGHAAQRGREPKIAERKRPIRCSAGPEARQQRIGQRLEPHGTDAQ